MWFDLFRDSNLLGVECSYLPQATLAEPLDNSLNGENSQKHIALGQLSVTTKHLFWVKKTILFLFVKGSALLNYIICIKDQQLCNYKWVSDVPEIMDFLL